MCRVACCNQVHRVTPSWVTRVRVSPLLGDTRVCVTRHVGRHAFFVYLHLES